MLCFMVIGLLVNCIIFVSHVTTQLCDLSIMYLCEFVDDFTWPKDHTSHPLLSLVNIGLQKVDIIFFVCHVSSRDHLIKGSYDSECIMNL